MWNNWPLDRGRALDAMSVCSRVLWGWRGYLGSVMVGDVLRKGFKVVMLLREVDAIVEAFCDDAKRTDDGCWSSGYLR